MNFQHVSTFWRNTGVVASLVAASTITASFLAPSASGISLVPQTEGEVDVGFEKTLSRGSYLELHQLIQSIKSLEDSSTGTKSRLFVDKAGTENTYGSKVKFQAYDIGTPADSFWFRPVAMKANGVTPWVEKGQLEVGTYEITFSEALKALTVSWFDTEYKGGHTSYSVNNGATGFVSAGKDKNLYTGTFTNVSSILLNLGEEGGGILANGKTVNWKGDGVTFQLYAESVPEPGTVFGLGALAVTGALGVGKRKKKTTLSN